MESFRARDKKWQQKKKSQYQITMSQCIFTTYARISFIKNFVYYQSPVIKVKTLMFYNLKLVMKSVIFFDISQKHFLFCSHIPFFLLSSLPPISQLNQNLSFQYVKSTGLYHRFPIFFYNYLNSINGNPWNFKDTKKEKFFSLLRMSNVPSPK